MRKRKVNLFFLIFLNFLLFSCGKPYKKIEIRNVSNFKIEKFSFSGISSKVEVEVFNPNPYNIEIKELEYDLYFQNELFTSGVSEINQTLKSKKVTFIEVPFTLKLSKAFEGGIKQLEGENFSYLVEGKAKVKALGKTLTRNFNFEKSLK